jgi:hypothetical protein
MSIRRRASRVCITIFAALSCAPVGEGGAPEDVEERREGLAFGHQGFARFEGDGTAVPGFTANTTGGAVEASRTSLGRYTVTFRSLGVLPTPPGEGGTVQVTAVGASNARCTLVSAWSVTAARDVVARVACNAPGAGPADSGFFAYFGRAPTTGRAAYARVNADASVPSTFQFNSTGAAITASHPGPGVYWVFIGAGARDGLQVTAMSANAHCHAALRELGVATVKCFDDLGRATDAPFTLNQLGTDSLALRGVGAFAQVRSSGGLDTRYDFNVCPRGGSTSSRVGVGLYEVSHTLVAESVFSYQVGAYGEDASYCKVAELLGRGTTAGAKVQCFSAAGVPVDSGFVETYAVDQGDCGGCPRSCDGGECRLGVCLPSTLASGLAPQSVGANGSTVWIGNRPLPGGALLLSVPRSGGPATTLVTVGETSHFAVDSVVVGADSVFWTELGSSGTGLFAKPLVGGARRRLAPGDGTVQVPRGVALAAGTAYYVDGFNGKLFSVTSSGVVTSLLPPDPPGDNFYPLNIATDGVRVYFVRGTGLRVSSVPVTGGAVTVLATVSGSATGTATSAITTDGTNVYFATSKLSGRIFVVPVTGGASSTFATTSGVVTGLALEGGTLFWTVKSAGKVESKPLAGGEVTTLASGEAGPNSLFVDASSLIWTTDTAVRKLAR